MSWFKKKPEIFDLGVTSTKCDICHVIFWVTEEFSDKVQENQSPFYCPNGHMGILEGGKKSYLVTIEQFKEGFQVGIPDE